MHDMRPRSLAALLLVLFCLTSGLRAALAQETPPNDSSKDSAGGTEKPDPAPSPDWERLIYLPYKNLRQVFDKEGAAVFMPYGQFIKLWDRLSQIDPRRPAKPPVGAVITETAYTGRIEKDVAHVEAQLTIQVLGKPWVELPITFGEAAIGKMTASDEKVLLQGTGNGTYALLFPKAGEHKVRLELTTRVRTSPDGRSLEFDCPASGVTSFDLTVPAADQSVEIMPQAIVGTADGNDQSTHVKAQLGATRKIAARWRPRVSTAPVMEVLTSVQNTLEVRVADGLVHTHAALTYQVLRGQLDQLRIAVPLGHRILDVTAAGLKSWKAVQEEKSQVVTVDLLSGDAKTVLVEVHTERPAPDGPFELAGLDDAGVYHGVHALGEVRENGLLVVSQSADLSLAIEQQSGLVRVEAAEVPETLRRPDSLYYKFYTPRFRLAVSARPVDPRLLVDERTQLAFRDEELQIVSQFNYTVERAGVFELRFKLPENLKIDRVDCEPMKEFQVPEGAGQLIVSLREKTRGQIAVTVTGHASLDPATKEAHPLPLLEPAGVARETGAIYVYAPESLEVIADEKGVQGAQPARPDAAQLQAIPGTRLTAAWSYTRRPVIPVRTERRPTRLTAAVATTINFRQDLAEVVTQIHYSVLFAGIDKFRFAVPEAVADRVQIETGEAAGVAVKQKSRAAEAENGWIAWTVVLQREVTGIIPIRVRYDLKPDQKGREATIAVEPLRVLETPGKTADAPAIIPAAVSGEIAVQKDRSLTVSAEADDFEPIDVRELTLLPQEGNLAYRYFKQPDKLDVPFSIAVTAARLEIQEVVETVVAQAFVEAVVSEDKSVTYRCRYRLKTSERQRLAIDLPRDAEILDALVAGSRVKLEQSDTATGAGGSKDWQSFRINVARSTPSDEAFVLALVVRLPFKDSPLRGKGGALKLPLPRIGGAAGTAGHSVAMQQVRVAIWVPKEYALVGAPEGFTSLRNTRIDFVTGAIGYFGQTTDLEAWFGDPTSTLFAFTPAGNAYAYERLGAADDVRAKYWRTNWFTWWISGALAAIAIVLVRTSWENRLTLLLLAAFGCALYALYDADLALNGLAAARFGLVALAAYWLIHALTRPHPRTTIAWRPGDPATAVSTLGAVIPPPGLFEKSDG